MYEMDKNYHSGECDAARRLIDRILANPDDLRISIHDGEETTVKKSRDREAILAALGTTGEDVVTVYVQNPADQKYRNVATFCLIWGNADDGSELVADTGYSDIGDGLDWEHFVEMVSANLEVADPEPAQTSGTVSYNHAYAFCFEVKGSKSPKGSDLTPAQIRAAIIKRLAEMPDEELMDAVGSPFDTVEEQ